MNGTFEVTSSTQNSQYNYKNGVLVVRGNVSKNLIEDKVTSIDGQVYAYDETKEANNFEGDYVGSFNGNMISDRMKYGVSPMSHEDSDKVWDAIDEIEAEVITNEEEAAA